MNLQYLDKQDELTILDAIPDQMFVRNQEFVRTEQYEEENSTNILLYGDNLLALKYLLTHRQMAGAIDLVYIDPPFATNNVFTVSFDRANTISNSANGTVAYSDKLQGAEFLEFLRKRLVVLKLLLSDKGSIYLHTDYKIGHYVKVIMDEIFGIDNFRNDITRIKCNPKNFARKGYGNIKDMILFYSKSNSPIWNEPVTPYSEADRTKLFPKIDVDGRRYTTIPLHAPGETRNGKTSHTFRGIKPPSGRHWRSDVETLERLDEAGLIEWSSNGNPRKKIFIEEQSGKRMQDIWELKDPQYPAYPTEKNADILETIIKTSSHENSIVLDCFCGSGTTLKAAQKLNRRWIGIDNSPEAINATIHKIETTEPTLFNPKTGYTFLTLAPRDYENT